MYACWAALHTSQYGRRKTRFWGVMQARGVGCNLNQFSHSLFLQVMHWFVLTTFVFLSTCPTLLEFGTRFVPVRGRLKCRWIYGILCFSDQIFWCMWQHAMWMSSISILSCYCLPVNLQGNWNLKVLMPFNRQGAPSFPTTIPCVCD